MYAQNVTTVEHFHHKKTAEQLLKTHQEFNE